MPSTSDPAIRAQGLGRRFVLRDARTRSLKEALVQRRVARTRELWALRGVDLEIARGETFGIVGQNGSGKSTLLKLFAGIYPPSEGTLAIDGVVGSLLEVGAGFHPEFSGIENVYLNASIYGIARGYVDRHLDEIIEFAELEEFASMPVKTYSSGMYTRLGFSVAMHMAPDILLLDEVLAVGDEAFQQKCFGKIWDFKRAGGTMVFVSHDPHAVELLCDRAILLERGRVAAEGTAQDVLVAYHRRLTERVAAQVAAQPGTTSGPCGIASLRALDGTGTYRTRFVEGEPLALELVLDAPDGLDDGRLSLSFRTQDGLVLAGRETGGLHLRPGAREVVRLHLASLGLREGTVSVDVTVTNHDASAVLAEETALLELTAFSREPHGLGLASLEATWELPVGEPVTDSLPGS